jgi:hypothetical protein
MEDRVRETTDVRFWEYVMYKTWKRGKGREEMEREVEVENLFPSPNVVSHENVDVFVGFTNLLVGVDFNIRF